MAPGPQWADKPLSSHSFPLHSLITAATSTDSWPTHLKSWKLLPPCLPPRPRTSRPVPVGRQAQWSSVNRWRLVCTSEQGSGNFHQRLSLHIILEVIWPGILSPFDSDVAAWRHKNNKQESSSRVTAWEWWVASTRGAGHVVVVAHPLS